MTPHVLNTILAVLLFNSGAVSNVPSGVCKRNNIEWWSADHYYLKNVQTPHLESVALDKHMYV